MVVTFLASCTKEARDCPKDKHNNDQVVSGSAKSTIILNNADGDVQNGGRGGQTVDGNDDGISDDGDDVGDGERNRKKRTN